jgi:hypothetical protein
MDAVPAIIVVGGRPNHTTAFIVVGGRPIIFKKEVSIEKY